MWARGAEGPRPSRGRWPYTPLVAFLALVAGAAVVFRDVLLPFVLSAFLVYLLAPVVDRLERVSVAGRHPPRWAAVLALYLGIGSVFAVVALTIIPVLVEELIRLSQTLPVLLKDANDRWLPAASQWLDRLIRRIFGASASRPVFDLEAEVRGSLQQTLDVVYSHAGDALSLGRRLVEGVIGGLTSTVLTLMVTAFLLIDSRSILDFVRRLVPDERRPRYDDLMAAIDSGLAGVIRGQLLICLVNGVLTWIGLALLDIPFALVLALIAGVFSLIPIFGTILSSIPSVMMGLTVGVGTAALVLGWILLIHALEANLLNPKIMGTAARIHPVVIVFALLAGEHAFGLFGALLAVPLVSIVQAMFLHFTADSPDAAAEPVADPAADAPAEAPPAAAVSEGTGTG